MHCSTGVETLFCIVELAFHARSARKQNRGRAMTSPYTRVPESIVIRGRLTPAYADILSAQALAFVAKLLQVEGRAAS
jgi:hypothetical protein